jgi:hypothetical protein
MRRAHVLVDLFSNEKGFFIALARAKTGRLSHRSSLLKISGQQSRSRKAVYE